jgi:hypothetical protein
VPSEPSLGVDVITVFLGAGFAAVALGGANSNVVTERVTKCGSPWKEQHWVGCITPDGDLVASSWCGSQQR